MKEYDVVALGELLIDFTENAISPQGNPMLEANPGGAVCNVLSMLERLGKKTAYIGKVGDDGFGHQLERAIAEQGIALDGLVFDKEVHTTLAIVTKTADGDRDFSFYRKPGADVNLKPEEVNEELIKEAKVFHFGTLSLTDEPAKSATQKALQVAKENGCIITFDPNLREPLWDSLEDAKREVGYGMSLCDAVKISDNEIQWFTGKENYDEGIAVLRETYPNLKLVCLTLGSEGSWAYYKDLKVEKSAYKATGDIETTGCGDTFCGSMINAILETGIDNFDEKSLGDMLMFGNAAASIVATRKGALRVMPNKDEVLALINK